MKTVDLKAVEQSEPMPMEEDMFQVFRRLGTSRIMAKLGNRTGDGRQTFYNKVSDVNKNYETCTTVLKCCNSFQCLEEDSEFDPIRIDPLNCEGFGVLLGTNWFLRRVVFL